jgi:hypothetical protein
MSTKIEEYEKLQAQADKAKEAAKEEMMRLIVEARKSLHEMEAEYERLYGKASGKRRRRTKAEMEAEKAKTAKPAKAAKPKAKKAAGKKGVAKSQAAE